LYTINRSQCRAKQHNISPGVERASDAVCRWTNSWICAMMQETSPCHWPNHSTLSHLHEYLQIIQHTSQSV